MIVYPYHFSVRLFTKVRRSSYGPMAFSSSGFHFLIGYVISVRDTEKFAETSHLSSMSAVMVHVSHAYKNMVCLFVVGCLTSQQQASVSQGRICSDNFTCCHTETEVADQTFYLTQSQYTDTGPTSPSADPRTPGAWQGSHWSANV